MYTDDMVQSVDDKLDFTPLKELNPHNGYISPNCRYCQCSSSSSEAKNSTTLEVPKMYTKCKVTWGGDWEWIAKILGLSGPSGHPFCPHCLVTIPDVKKGKPHALHILEEFRDDNEDNGIPAVAQRKLSTCHAKATEFQEDGAIRENAMRYDNCIQRSLVGTEGYITEQVSVSPFHIGLGLGLQFYGIVENNANSLDIEVLENHGIYNGVDKLYARVEDLGKENDELCNSKRELEIELVAKHDQIAQVQTNNPNHFMKNDRKYTDNSALAKESRKLVQQLNTDIKEINR